MAQTRTRQVVLTVDLESILHAHPMYGPVGPVRRQQADAGLSLTATARILELLANHGARATFFIVSEIADWYPALVERIASEGHELAFHTHDHTIITSPAVLEEQLRKGGAFLSRYRVKGFRAPYYRLDGDCLRRLRDRGFQYDSSFYGFAGSFEIQAGFWEIPITHLPRDGRLRRPNLERPSPLTLRSLLRGLPLGSGLSWGVPWFPWIRMIDRCHDNGITPLLTVHPWQFTRPRHLWFLSRSFLGQRPWWLPYSREIGNTFRQVLSHFSATSIEAEYFSADILSPEESSPRQSPESH